MRTKLLEIRLRPLIVAILGTLMVAAGDSVAIAGVLTVPPAPPRIPDRQFAVLHYGAIGDGVATNTAAIQAAIDAANRVGGGIVNVPRGVFLCGPLKMADNIELHLQPGAILRMLPLGKYPGGTVDPRNFISGARLHDIAISGSGMIDGQGIPWWPYAKQRGARRPRMITFSSCRRVLISGVTLTNSPMFHIAISHSSDVTVRGVTIRANPSSDPVHPGHNTDACDVSGHRILIENCNVSVGDDDYTCGGGTSDVLITNCVYGYGHGVSIGSGTHGGVSNIEVINCTFNNTEQGIRIKSARGRGGFVHNISYLNLHMTNVNYPILIYGTYTATNRAYRELTKLRAAVAATYPRKPMTSRTPIFSDITFSNITATVRPGRRAGLIWGLPEAPITNVLLQKVNITADKPFGVYFAKNVRFVNCHIVTRKGVNKISTTHARVSIIPNQSAENSR